MGVLLRGSCCGAAGASLRLTLGASSPAASFPGEPRCGFGGFVLRRRGGRGPTLCSVRFSSSPVPLVSPPTSVFYTLLLSPRGAVPAPRDATATLGSTRRAVGRPLWVPCLLDTAVKLFLLGIHTGMRSITAVMHFLAICCFSFNKRTLGCRFPEKAKPTGLPPSASPHTGQSHSGCLHLSPLAHPWKVQGKGCLQGFMLACCESPGWVVAGHVSDP